MKDYIATLILCLCLSAISVIPSKASLRSDSLTQVIYNESDPMKVLSALKDISLMYRDKPEEIYYLTLLLEKTSQIDSISLVYDAMSNLSRHYYNRSEIDSLTYWTNKVDSLVSVRNDNPNAYYDVHSFISKYQLSQGHIETAIYEAIKIQKKAKETNQIYGQICSAETLGMIYGQSNRQALAITSYQEALDMLEKIQGDLYYRIYIQSNQVQAILLLPDQSETEKYLKRYNAYIAQWEEENRQSSSEKILNVHHWMSLSFYAGYYIKIGQTKKAKEALDKSIAYGQQLNLTDVWNIAVVYCYLEQACYYQEIKKYPQALEALDAILNEYFDQEFAQKKIDILTTMGRYEEAANLYKELVQFAENQNNSNSARQIAQLRSLYDVNNMEVQSLELKMADANASQKQHLLLLSFAVLLALIILTYFLFGLLKRFRQLKDDLEREKHSLQESQKGIREATEKIEKSSQMKSIFISNVSHEIRTPLNAIVGFSSLVIDPDSSEEEKKEFTSIISNNSDLLLNIINDILNLSKMESEDVKFNIKLCELHTICKEVLASVEHRLQPGVKTALSFQRDSFTLSTDPLRLRQLLLNLLINATKFTKEGQIELAVDIDDEKQLIRFSITDTGCGIPVELQEKIFERFEKVHEYIQGTGLGLAICKMITEHLHGSIFVDSSYTGGARFIFIHPFDPSKLIHDNDE